MLSSFDCFFLSLLVLSGERTKTVQKQQNQYALKCQWFARPPIILRFLDEVFKQNYCHKDLPMLKPYLIGTKLSDPAEYWNNYLFLNFPHFWLVAKSNPVGFSDFKDFMQKIWASLGLIVKYILIFRDIFVPLCAFVLFLHSFSLITRTIKTDMPFHILSYSLKIHSTLELIVITKSSQNGVDLQRYLSFQSFLWIFWRGIRTFLH